jgi:hypothetical protein
VITETFHPFLHRWTGIDFVSGGLCGCGGIFGIFKFLNILTEGVYKAGAMG